MELGEWEKVRRWRRGGKKNKTKNGKKHGKNER